MSEKPRKVFIAQSEKGPRIINMDDPSGRLIADTVEGILYVEHSAYKALEQKFAVAESAIKNYIRQFKQPRLICPELVDALEQIEEALALCEIM